MLAVARDVLEEKVNIEEVIKEDIKIKKNNV
jgi:hypothetical protein